MTLDEWLDKWLDEYMILTDREGTLDSYRAMVKIKSSTSSGASRYPH